MEKTKFIVIRDYCNQGKTTTMWLLLKALIEDGARVYKLMDLNRDHIIKIPSEMPPKGELEHIDYMAVLEWHELIIVLNSRGDYVYKPVNDINIVINKWNPDYIICTIQNRDRITDTSNNIWNYFDKHLPNSKYERVCFWTEYATDETDAIRVKMPTVSAIIKYMA